ncbi:PREDICTED: melanoma antigen preferentially expressed in tumors [Chinchilla lanigera]|uniref:PRAME nuclear receptor transcriptional regulator n=1 Tax=Chinchilla lanigera TaxID=34839 RepID=A0A8C2V6Q5_CHILA|nr:PREDICTED: melanoma antigen preferentially expressed in tumors [Chinchilla lanigera]XP_013375845.1 PREDICTED: melanoma antigen preferentially expressed in tumors [Chinchilla lanigera]
MTMVAPPRLLDLAVQSLLRDEALAIAALEELPIELFPPLFIAAYTRRCSKTLKAMVQAWPFACLPLGGLMTEQQPQQEVLEAALSGLDVLLSEEVRPRRWKMQVLDLRKNAHQDFWTIWSGTRIGVWSLTELEAAQPMKKKQKMGGFERGANQPFAPMKVLLDLCLKQGRNDDLLSSLMKKVRQKKDSLHLCCKKLKIFAMPIQNIKMILKMVQLDSVQDLEVNCTWKLSTFGNFAPYLGQMGNLRRLLLSHILTSSCTYLGKEEQYVNQFTSQFLSFHHLQELYLDSVSFLKGRLDKVLRCLKSSLETLSITNCLLSESDLMHLSQCPNMSQLKDLSLSGVSLTTVSPEPLRVLLERASSTLEDLDLDECGIMDTHFIALLPALSQCSQLTTFTFCGNSISMAVLQELLLHTIGLSKLSHVLYPAPLESYAGTQGILHLGRLAELHGKLKQMLHDAGRQAVVWFSANPCPHCGDKTLYDPEPILCPCYLPF